MTYEDQVTAYALGELTEHERRQFEAQAGPDLLAQAVSYREALTEVGISLPLISPPTRLKAAVMQQVRNTPQPRPTPELSDPTPPATLASTPSTSRLKPSLLALAASLAAIMAGVWSYNQHLQVQDLQRDLAAVTAQQQSLIEQISMAEDVSLAKGDMGSSTVSVLYSPSHNMAGITTSGLPALPEGQIYMIWLYDAHGTIVGSGTLDVHHSTTTLSELVDQDLSQVVEFGISIETINAHQPSAKPFMLDTMGTRS